MVEKQLADGENPTSIHKIPEIPSLQSNNPMDPYTKSIIPSNPIQKETPFLMSVAGNKAEKGQNKQGQS